MRLAAAAAAVLVAAGCGGGGGGGCRSFDSLASGDPTDDDPRVAAGTQLATATKQGATGNVAAQLAPSVSPAYQRLEVGKTATWGVAVVQLADRSRTLRVDFADGGAPRTSTVSKGSGACLIRVTRSFPTARKAHAVHFTVLDAADAPAGPTIDVFLDVA